MFKYIEITDFRLLKDKRVKLGKYVTMFSGWNATGKSTILALLANSTESKDKNPFTGQPFRSDFSEILKGSLTFDKTQSNRLKIGKEKDGKIIEKKFRTAWQNNKTRFRVIPVEKDENGYKNEAKFESPVIYLGLSRLLPMGELKDNTLESESITFSEEDTSWFYETHQDILSYHDEIKNVKKIKTDSPKNGLAVETKEYDWKSNSSGQDNLGQILIGLLALKNNLLENKNNTGLFIIDEFEASLHPRAQEKLIDFFITFSKKNNIQIILTTHSLYAIKHFSEKTKEDRNEHFYHYYFTKPNLELELWENPLFEKLEKDLTVSLYSPSTTKKIKIYTEDNEARWFLKKILKGFCNKLDFVNCNIGCQNLIDVMNVEDSFANNIIVFDGDLNIASQKRIKKKKNFLILPTNDNKKESPEKTLRDFLMSEKANNFYSNNSNKIQEINRTYFLEHDIKQSGDKKEREFAKDWFKMHKDLLEKGKLFDEWKKENKDLVNDFRKKFIILHNKIAERINIPKLQQ